MCQNKPKENWTDLALNSNSLFICDGGEDLKAGNDIRLCHIIMGKGEEEKGGTQRKVKQVKGEKEEKGDKWNKEGKEKKEKGGKEEHLKRRKG